MYELLIQWRATGKTPAFELDNLRQQLSVETTQYKTMSNLKKYVLYFAVKQINDHTDITVNHNQQKDSDPLDKYAPLKMNDKQRGTFAAKLAQMSELSDRAKQGEDYKQFAARIELDLLDESKQEFYFPFLKKLGFQQS